MLVVTARPGVSGVCYSRRCGSDIIAFTSEGPLKYGCDIRILTVKQFCKVIITEGGMFLMFTHCFVGIIITNINK